MTEGNAMTEQRHSSRWPRAAVGRIAPLAARCRQPARYLHGLTVLSATVALKEPQSYRNRSEEVTEQTFRDRGTASMEPVEHVESLRHRNRC